MSQHPYSALPDYAFWSRAVTRSKRDDVDPVVSLPFRIGRGDKVATAGSCFAQHIARHLKSTGFNYYVTESVHPLVQAESADANYGTFTARYGNIYTTRQLVQLFDRAYGRFKPTDDVWQNDEGAFLDAFRPTIQPGGFVTRAELLADQKQHLAAVRKAFENLDIFVFTMGLTECWISKIDGVVYPVCPGVSGGKFSNDRYEFKNLTVNEVVEDLNYFALHLKSVNPSAKIILTVSPVPLAASASGKHVLTSTTLSKAILRVAADIFVSAHSNAAYFPSFEVITGNFNRGEYYSSDLRNVTEDGVGHVMALFLKHGTVGGGRSIEPRPAAAAERADSGRFEREMQNWVEVMCDEVALDPH